MAGGRLAALLALSFAAAVAITRRQKIFAKQPKAATPAKIAAPTAKTEGGALAAPWMKPLKGALQHGGTQRHKRDRSDAKRKQVQLATVDPATMRPSVRTIVFRGFMPRGLMAAADCGKPNEESCALMFITDSRADKVRHISSGGSFVECCWWLDEAGAQFRISGTAVLATANSEDSTLRAACETVWERLTTSTKQTFFWPSPGAPASQDAVTKRAKARSEEEEECAASSEAELSLAKANFVLLIVLPDRVDELRLGGKQRRNLYTLEREIGEAPAQGGAAQLARWSKTRWAQVATNP